MAKKAFENLGNVKSVLNNARNKVTAAASKALDANDDGTIDIQDIIIYAVRTPGVHVTRAKFLEREFSGKHPEDIITKAIAETPSQAGIPLEEIDKIADEVIKFERNCVSGISAALGMPGGAAMAATIPADIAQYYGYTLRAIQKLLYLYGFPEIDSDGEGISLDTDTVNRIVLCLGVMNGVAGANNAVKAMAKALSKGVEKKLISTALTKGTFYPFIKSIMKWFGVKLTKEIFAKSIKNAIPVVGGIVGGGLTFFAFKPCCERLKEALTDTLLTNPRHVSTEEEDRIYTEIVESVEYDDTSELTEGGQDDENADSSAK